MLPSVMEVSEGSWGRGTIYKVKGMDEEKSQEQVKRKSQEQSKETQQSHMSIKQGKDSQVSLKRSKDSESRSIDQSGGKLTSSADVSDIIEDTTVLPYLHATLFGTILEDTLTQLKILVEDSNEIKILKTKLDWDFLLRKKYGVKEAEFVDELEGLDPKTIFSNEHKINKLDFDRIFVIDVLKGTYKDLTLHKNFKYLQDSVNAILALDNYRIALAEEEARNRVLRRDLARQLRQLRNHIKTVLYDSEVKIDGLIAQVEDAILISECRSRYIDNWQRARTEQHTETIHEKEAVFTDSIEYYKQRSDHEHRVHMEVEMLINIAINEILQQIEERMAKYDTDIEAIQLKIQIKKNDYQNMLDRRIELETTIEEHDKMMDEWVSFKDEREKLRQYREKMNNAAIAVQAWWRGLLVRRQLGPYKPKKKKKAEKKK